MLSFVDDMAPYLKDELSSNKVEIVIIKVHLQKRKEVIKTCISIVKDNVNKEIYHGSRWPKMPKLKLSMLKKKLTQMLLV